MKKISVLVTSVAMTSLMLFGSISLIPASTSAKTTQSKSKVFTLAQLKKYDGTNGKPAYIAVNKVVYDVSKVRQWRNGKHNGFTAGNDLTKAIKSAPHGESVLKGLPIVGKLK